MREKRKKELEDISIHRMVARKGYPLFHSENGLKKGGKLNTEA